ncbi:MAG: rRNA adenine N-6-methyltransferase family protein, partial [Verrucomicrobiota bacterium]|nr:rRNA adenine N-6-methyltransferase family protein [Verrucomicrobiota bacterium]
MTLSEIRNFLNDKDILLTRSLGQTFMHDQNQLRKIVALARLAPGDSVIEIGPGLGPLTELLLEVAGHVTAIDTDRRLVKLLEERLGQRDNFTLQHAD